MLAKTPKQRRHENPKDAFLGSEDNDFWPGNSGENHNLFSSSSLAGVAIWWMVTEEGWTR
jgi:hypothetical protein